MYQLKAIGKLYGGRKNEIEIQSNYRKALKRLDTFSHVHLFYVVSKAGEWKLETQIVEIEGVEIKSGKVKIKKWDKAEQEVEIVDIKPYFPCEDSVRERCENPLPIQRNMTLLPIDGRENEFEIKKVGCIRQTHGLIYIEIDENIPIKSNYIKVIWWFDQFDKAQYRKAVECNPPYEDAPRSGIFATRSPVRPNPLAMTVAKVEKIDERLNRIYISGIESFDKTPCLGIMDYQTELDYIEEVRVPEYLAHWPQWLDIRKQDESAETEHNGQEDSIGSVLDLLKKSEQETLIQGKTDDWASHQKGHANKEDGIWVKGARENNLKSIDVKVPYEKITAVVGVSGSGKSSLIKDTIYAECKRRMEYLSNDHNVLARPQMEYMSGCIPSVMIQQNAIRGNSQSTIGTYTSCYDYIRMIYASVGVRHCPRCGHEIIPLTKEKIKTLLTKQDQVVIYSLNQQKVSGSTLEEQIDQALAIGKGAFYAKVGTGNLILLQTKQKCFHCDTLMFELTPSTFSYLDLENRCPRCNGTGKVVEADPKKIIEHPEQSIMQGASSFWGKLKSFKENPNANWMKGQVIGLADKMEVDLEKPWNELPEAFQKKLLWGSEEQVTFSYDNKKNGRKGEITRQVEGVIPIIERLFNENDAAKQMEKYLTSVPCMACHGERLGKEGREVTIGSYRYPEVAALSFKEIKAWCEDLPKLLGWETYEKIKNPVSRLLELVEAAKSLGIDYLNLNRETSTLSGGEGQRLKLLAALQNHMTGLLYVFDEPSKGLHPKDYEKVAKVLYDLKEEGNTVIMVEHNEDMIKVADYIIEIGPASGEEGGYLAMAGSQEAMLAHNGSQIGKYLSHKGHKPLYPIRNLDKAKFIGMEHLNYNNLKDVSISFPKEALTCICGVSGSGKSSLMRGEIYEYFSKAKTFKEVCLVDQKPIGKSSRSVIATYMDIMDEIRSKMAKTEEAIALSYDEKLFSFNGEEGQCETCKGEGRIKLKYLEDTYVPCTECKGKRYKKSVLKVTYKEKNIAQLLEMSVKDAVTFWEGQKEMVDALQVMEEVGLGYLKLGQSTSTLSGGEASRLKLAKELVGSKRQNVLYLFDEPTTGLHFSDIDRILELIHKLIEKGNTVMAIEHNKQFLANCDWKIEIGPGAGEAGGQIIYQGKVK